MVNLNYHNMAWFLAVNMSLLWIVNAGLIYYPTSYDDKFLDIFELYGLTNQDDKCRVNHEKYGANMYQSLLRSLYDAEIM